MNLPEKQRTIAEQLATPVQYLRGVGPQRAELLARLGLFAAKDLLFFFPRSYEDLTDRRDVVNLEEGKIQTVVGTVEESELRGTGAGRSILGVLIRGNAGFLRVWFNQPFMQRTLHSWSTGDALGQAEVPGIDVGDVPSAGRPPGGRGRRAPARSCPSIH